MRVALINPNWSFDGSVYFGCRAPHLPLELGYAKALLERNGHEAEIIDAHLFGLSSTQIRDRIAAFRPRMTVITTAPTYLFWRCPPPELRVPQALATAVRDVVGLLVAVGPHGSTTPRATLKKLRADVVVLGECEEVVARLAEGDDLDRVSSVGFREGGETRIQGKPHAGAFADLPALRWPAEWIERHGHHHHRFDAAPQGPGAEIEASRGCPYRCTFCAKENFRDRYRRRNLDSLLEEIDELQAQGCEYIYFVDEIFLPNAPLLEALIGRGLKFGVQTRIDLWKSEAIALLGEAGCVSIEAGVESITPEGRNLLDKNCRVSTEELTERLIFAKRHVPFVQANLLAMPTDDREALRRWRETVRAHGVWANDPVPLFPYPGSPDYRKLWGVPDDHAWERAVDHYLTRFSGFSDIQDDRPRRLHDLEKADAE